jgi:hypothetical protein
MKYLVFRRYNYELRKHRLARLDQAMVKVWWDQVEIGQVRSGRLLFIIEFSLKAFTFRQSQMRNHGQRTPE